MPIIGNFYLARYEDGVLSIQLTPPTPIGGWSIQFQLMERFNASVDLYDAYVASGFNGTSGITVTNSGQAMFNVTIPSNSGSSMNEGNYAFKVTRTNSGSQTTLSEGYLILTP